MNAQTSLPTKRWFCILRLGLVAALAVLAVAALSWGLGSTASAGSEQVAVGLICDTGGMEDLAFNWLSIQGLRRAEAELGVVGTVYTPTDPSQYEAAVQQCADDGNDLCIGVGFFLADPVWNVAQANPGSDFAVIDYTWNDYPDNLRGMAFAEDEVGYLAGILAGMMTQSDVIGDIGGMPIPPVERFVYGYRNGARCANPNVDVLIDYTWDFADPELGAQFAQNMIAQGADVIFAVAGLNGFGAVLTATQSGVYGIGVDTDFYYTVFMTGTVDGSDLLLSSAMKRLDNAVFLTIQDVVSGTFSSGTVLYDLAVDGVGLAPFHETDPLVPQSVRDALEAARLGIISGTVDVNDPCWVTARYVDGASGSDDSDCSDPADPCQSVGHALNQAQPDDRIRIAQGVYTDNLWLDRRVVLEGGYAGPPDWPRDLGQYETILRSASVTFPGDWDGSGIFAPMVISDGGEYRMWYVGYDLYGYSSGHVGAATSLDGIAWSKSISNPLTPGMEPMVHMNGPADYEMWFSQDDVAIYHATSSDGLSWDVSPAPVFEPSYADTFDRDHVGDPSIVQDDDGTYWMFYEAANWDWYVLEIGVATSTNGLDWSRVQTTPVLGVGAPGEWDELWVLDPMVVYESGLFRMWYSGLDAGWTRQIGTATSTDGIHWARDTANNPVFSPDPGQWDDGNVGNHFVLHDGDYWMWYSSNGRIGVVTSTDGLNWNRFLPDPVLTPGLHGEWGQPVVRFAYGSDGAVLDGFTITGADVGDDGAISIYGASPTIRSCRITGNVSQGPDEWGAGGILIREGASPLIEQTIIVSNTAYGGAGGVRVGGASFTMINSMIVGNVDRPAIHANDASLILTNVTIADNQNVGILLNGAHGTVLNSIVWEVDAPDIETPGGGTYTVDFSDLEDGVYTGTGNISADPLFVGVGDYHLQPASPCVDSGTNTGAPAKDFEGDRRPLDGDVDGVAITDMGADEYAPPMIFLPVVMRNG